MSTIFDTDQYKSYAMPSSVIASIHYNETSKTLTIVYVSGAIYHYLNVPAETYAELKNAPSRGTYLNREIKGRFEYEKIE